MGETSKLDLLRRWVTASSRPIKSEEGSRISHVQIFSVAI
jgi:hypothetical protein